MKRNPTACITSVRNGSGTMKKSLPDLGNPRRKKKNFLARIHLPILFPLLMLSSAVLCSIHAQTEKRITILHRQDFNHLANAWNSSKAAEPISEREYFSGKAYCARRAVKIASSQEEGCLHLDFSAFEPVEELMLTVRGARYDKSKASHLIAELKLHTGERLTDTLHFESFYKESDSEPYRNNDSMTQPGSDFSSCDTALWRFPGKPVRIEKLEIRAGADDQCYLDEYSLASLSCQEPLPDSCPQDGLSSCRLSVIVPADNHVYAENDVSFSFSVSDFRLGKDGAIAVSMQDSIFYSDSIRYKSPYQGKGDYIASFFLVDTAFRILGDTLIRRSFHVKTADSSGRDTVCAPPAHTRADSVTFHSALLSWEHCAERYWIRLHTLFEEWMQVGTAENRYKISGLSPFTVYWWEIAPICGTDTGDFVPGAYFQTLDENVRNEETETEMMADPAIFPNPNRGNFWISMPQPGQATIFRTNGQAAFSRHLEKGLHSLRLDESGIYILHFPGKPQIRRKIIIVTP